MSKVLFILKRRDNFNPEKHSALGMSTGLYNSAKFMNEIVPNSKMVVVRDNNDIDREVTLFRPTHVIIEAVWVIPSKFIILQKLHPKVKWIIRLHSEMPFIAGESRAMDWIAEYAKFDCITLACNAPRFMRETKTYLNAMGLNADEKVIYLPNFYPQEYKEKHFDKNKDHIDIGCFSAIRPLKNQLLQSIAAIQFANDIGKKLKFHINSGRIEMNGSPVLNNLKHVFEHLYDAGHELVNHEWTPRKQFLELCASMDIGLQVSFSETFNIVGADLISQGVPLVSSKEIPWASTLWNADPTDSDEICKKLHMVYTSPTTNVYLNQMKLTKYTTETKNIWDKYFGN